MTSIITVRGLGYEFPDGHTPFKNLNFSLDRRITALVGPNGVGKTTLAKLIIGQLTPSQGTIDCKSSITYFTQRKEPSTTLTVDEFLGTPCDWTAFRFQLLEGINPSNSCQSLSGGQWMRVRLAQALGDCFLILDEPTNDLDRQGRDLVFRFLKETTAGALLISHDRECLSISEDILELSNLGLQKYGGGWATYESEKEKESARREESLQFAKRARDQAIALRHDENLKQEKRNRRGSKIAKRGGHPKILIGAQKRRAQSTTGKINNSTLQKTEEAVREAHSAFESLKIDSVIYADLQIDPLPAQKLVAHANSFNVHFKDWVYSENLNFLWRGNIRMALTGENGSGKSTLLRALNREQLNFRGLLRVGNLTTVYLDQHCATLNDSQNILENVRDSCSGTESEIRSRLAPFLFTKERVFQKVASLSGGERLRASLAKAFLAPQIPQLLLLDEPTNNLDLVNVEFLENFVSAFTGALIVVSHDETFLKNCRIEERFRVK